MGEAAGSGLENAGFRNPNKPLPLGHPPSDVVAPIKDITAPDVGGKIGTIPSKRDKALDEHQRRVTVAGLETDYAKPISKIIQMTYEMGLSVNQMSRWLQLPGSFIRKEMESGNVTRRSFSEATKAQWKRNGKQRMIANLQSDEARLARSESQKDNWQNNPKREEQRRAKKEASIQHRAERRVAVLGTELPEEQRAKLDYLYRPKAEGGMGLSKEEIAAYFEKQDRHTRFDEIGQMMKDLGLETRPRLVGQEAARIKPDEREKIAALYESHALQEILSSEQLDVIERRYGFGPYKEGTTFAEIAKIRNVTPGAVKNMYYRSLGLIGIDLSKK